MAFDAGAIIARLKLDAKQFTGQMKKSRKDTKGMTKDIRGMGLAMKGVMVGALAVGTKALFNFTDQAAKLHDMRGAFDRLADGAGLSSREIIRDVRGITKALSDREIIKAANTLELLGVGMGRTAQLAEIARAAGVALGKDTAFMLESIATGTARQSRLWLDNLGIIISVEEANRDFAESHGLLASKLTDTQKRAAFLNSVLSKGKEIVSKVGGGTELAAEKTGRLSATMQNLGDSIKNNLVAFGLPDLLASIASGIDSITAAQKRNQAQIKQGQSQGLIPRFGVGGGVTGFFDPKSGKTTRGLPHPPLAGPSPFNTTTGATAGGGRVANAATAAQVAAKAYFDSLIASRGGANRPLPVSGAGAGTPHLGLDFGEIPIPELVNNLGEVEEKFLNLGALAASFGASLAAVAGSGGDFGVAMARGIGTAAISMGTFLIASGIGVEKLKKLKGAGAVIAGIALLGLGAGVNAALSSGFSSGFSGGSGGGSIPSTGGTSPGVNSEGRGTTTIIIENVNGTVSQEFIDNLTRDIDTSRRRRGETVVFV